MSIDITKAKKTLDTLKKYSSNPLSLYRDCDERHMTLTEYLESLDPTELDADGNRITSHDAFDRLFMAFESPLSGSASLTLEKLMAGGTLMLVPELIKREVQYGMTLSSSSYDDLIAAKVPHDSASYHPVYIQNQNLDSAVERKKKSLAQRASVDKGGAFPKLSLRYREKTITLGDYGMEVEASYSLLKGKHWPDIRVIFQLIGAQIAVDKLYDLHYIGLNGDGTVGACSDLFTGTSGALSYADLAHAFTSFNAPYVLNAFLCPQTSLETILTMPQFQDPLANFEFQKTGKLVTPMGAKLKKVGSTAGGSPTATEIVCIDTRFSFREVSTQGLTIEAEKIIERKFERCVISEECAFSIISDGAIKSLKWT